MTTTLEEIQEGLARLARQLKYGCGDGSCQVQTPRGMHTNGGCRCHPRDVSQTLLDLGRRPWPRAS